jgi:hypothetical protein
MGTRLKYEKMLLDAFPQIQQLRVYSPGEFKVFIYAAEKDFNLSDSLKQQIEEYFKLNGLANLQHIVKSYLCIEKDSIPPISDPPPDIKLLALSGKINAAGIKQSLDFYFPHLNLNIHSVSGDTVKIGAPCEIYLTDIEKMLIKDYIQEIIPLGLKVMIA